MTTEIFGASAWEQELYTHLVSHVEDERAVLQSYEALAADTDSPAFGYLARLILDDERRHHQLLHELAETIRTTAELSGEPAPIPSLGSFRANRERILAETERFLAIEEEDDRELERIAKELRNVRNTTMWELVIRLIQADNAKHRRILTFIRDRAREHK